MKSCGSSCKARSKYRKGLVRVGFSHLPIEHSPALHREIDGVGVVRPLARRAQGFGLDELDAERIGEARDNIDLQLAELAHARPRTGRPTHARRSRSR